MKIWKLSASVVVCVGTVVSTALYVKYAEGAVLLLGAPVTAASVQLFVGCPFCWLYITLLPDAKLGTDCPDGVYTICGARAINVPAVTELLAGMLFSVVTVIIFPAPVAKATALLRVMLLTL